MWWWLGRVHALWTVCNRHLEGNSLSGTIPTEMGELTSLTSMCAAHLPSYYLHDVDMTRYKHSGTKCLCVVSINRAGEYCFSVLVLE